jgi:LPXTG-motif cell wall-anchored protein
MHRNVAFARPRRARRAVAVAFTGLLVAVGAALAQAPAADAGGLGHLPGTSKVSICQATGDRTNPYVKLDLDVLVALKLSHGGHRGPSFSGKLDKKISWGDVIPPFELDLGKGHFGGKNWDKTGKDIHDRGCKCPDSDTPGPTVPTPGTRPGTPTTRPETPPTTVKPVDTRPATTAPRASTTAAPAPTTTVTVKSGVVTTTPPTTAGTGTLPVTGSGSGLLAGVGLVLCAAGAAVLVLRKRSVA